MNVLIDEKSSTKVAALFADEASARGTIEEARAAAGLTPGQARLLTPADATRAGQDWFGEKVEPENRGIARTFVRSHLVLGALGALVGLALWWWLRDAALLASTPWAGFVALVGFGATFGLLAGGLVAFRPDHVRLITRLRTGLRRGQWGAIFHPVNAEQADAVRGTLRQHKVEVFSSL